MLGSNNYLGLTGDPRVEAGRPRGAGDTTAPGSPARACSTAPRRSTSSSSASSPSGWGPTTRSSSPPATRPTPGAARDDPRAAATRSICDSGDHASILDGCRLSGRETARPSATTGMDKLEKMLQRAAEDGGGVLVVVDGVFSMEGDVRDAAADRRAVPSATAPA